MSPPAPWHQNETQSLFEVIRTLRDQGVVVIYISHRLQELWEIADTVTVLRDGKLIGKKDIKDLGPQGHHQHDVRRCGTQNPPQGPEGV